ncbi:MAG: GNAT family N-acetyltransferase [Acidobacteriota bacterium]|nr:GNAT family N-acetyltransferase [Acidobacteriota bacterium]
MARRELPGGFELDDDPARVDVGAVHAFVSRDSYWGRGRPREQVERAIAGSTRVVGLYHGTRMVGFARAVSDTAVMAYLADVYVEAGHRGGGLGLELVREMVDRGPLKDLSWLLNTADAGGLYERLGFSAACRYPPMERRGPAGEGGAPGGETDTRR